MMHTLGKNDVVIDDFVDYANHGEWTPMKKGVGPLKSGKLDGKSLHGVIHHELEGNVVAMETSVCSFFGSLCTSCVAGSTSFDHNYEAPPEVLAIVKRLEKMVNDVRAESKDILDQDWKGPKGLSPLDVLCDSKDEAVHCKTIRMLAQQVAPMLAQENTLVDIAAPTKIVGDIHGQFRDIMMIFADFGFPSKESDMRFVFNGDWVDRGRHQLEVVVMVFTLKLFLPSKIVLLRGNHEDPVQNEFMGKFGFKHRCGLRLGLMEGLEVFKAVHEAFAYLPLGCRIDGEVLVVHGGIGDGAWGLHHIQATKRPLHHAELGEDPVLWNLLWSDPLPDELGAQSFGAHSSPRDGHDGVCKTFGKDVTKRFCAANGLAMVVRSHQVKQMGKGYDVMHDGKLLTVFSARDYEGAQNDGAILDLSKHPQTGKLLVKPQVLISNTKTSHSYELKGAYDDGSDSSKCVLQ